MLAGNNAGEECSTTKGIAVIRCENKTPGEASVSLNNIRAFRGGETLLLLLESSIVIINVVYNANSVNSK